jgi:hypothetical protein
MPVYIDSEDDSVCNTNTSIDIDECSSTHSICCKSEHDFDDDTCCENISNNMGCENNTVDIASIYNYEINKQTRASTVCFRFTKIDITFDDFKRLFFKKKCGRQYHLFTPVFTNLLLNNVKPMILCRLLNSQYNINCLHSKTKILLHRELWSLDIVNQCEKIDVLNYSECMRSLYSLDTSMISVTVNIFLHSLSIIAKIVFLFDISQIPENPDPTILDISIY